MYVNHRFGTVALILSLLINNVHSSQRLRRGGKAYHGKHNGNGIATNNTDIDNTSIKGKISRDKRALDDIENDEYGYDDDGYIRAQNKILEDLVEEKKRAKAEGEVKEKKIGEEKTKENPKSMFGNGDNDGDEDGGFDDNDYGDDNDDGDDDDDDDDDGAINVTYNDEDGDADEDANIDKSEGDSERTETPTVSPTITPLTEKPTKSVTGSPTSKPIESTPLETSSPTVSPTPSPTSSPTLSPTSSPTSSPIVLTTSSPTSTPIEISAKVNNGEERNHKDGGEHDHNNEQEYGDDNLPLTSSPTKQSSAPTPSPMSSPTDDEDPSEMFENLPEEEKEYIEHIEKVDEEETAAKISIGFIFLTLGLMICTAQQMGENPDGVYANICRLAITVTSCVFKMILFPFRKVFGFGAGGYAHHLVTTQEFRDPYATNRSNRMEFI